MLNFSKILVKFAIVLKIFENFCPCTIITGQRSFSSQADELLDINPETKNIFEHFHCKIGSSLKILRYFAVFQNISFFLFIY